VVPVCGFLVVSVCVFFFLQWWWPVAGVGGSGMWVLIRFMVVM